MAKESENTGDYSAIASVNKGRKTKIANEEKFRKFVREHSDKTQKQMAEIWGENLTQQNISYFCQKLGITRKKTYGYQERNEEERAEFRQK